MRCGAARIGWTRRTWPTGWPCAAGNWPRVSWSTSPTSLISWAARPVSGRGLLSSVQTPRKQVVAATPGFGGQVGGVGLGEVQRGGDLPGDRDAQAGQLSALVRVVAQQRDAADAERVQHLGRAGVVALVGPVTEREVRVVRVQATILQRVGVEFVVE